MIAVAAAGSIANFKNRETKHTISGNLEVDVRAGSISEKLRGVPKWNLMGPRLWYANFSDYKGPDYDANGNVLP
jgi:hypothetical protein